MFGGVVISDPRVILILAGCGVRRENVHSTVRNHSLLLTMLQGTKLLQDEASEEKGERARMVGCSNNPTL